MVLVPLNSEHGYVIVASAIMSLQCVLSSIALGSLRKKFDLPYSDSGDGRFSKKLSDKQWEEFHNAQRAHRNYTEQIGVAQALLLSASVLHPTLAVITGAIYILGRQLYYHGYINSGPEGRLYGVILIYLSILTWFGTSIYSGLTLTGIL